MQLITIKELADKLMTSTKWVEEAVVTGLVPPPIRLGGHIRWADKTIDKWIEDGCPRADKIIDKIIKELANKNSQNNKTLNELEREAIIITLKKTNNNREETARLLGIGERTIYRKIKEYGLDTS